MPRRSRRHPVQRRLLHPSDLPRPRHRSDRDLVWPRSGGPREPRPRSRGRRRRRLLLATCAPPAAACWSAAACLAPTTSASAAPREKPARPRSAWYRAARKRARLLEIDRDDLHLVANRPVAFRLYSSLTRTGEQLGQFIDFSPDAGSSRPRAAPRRDPLRQARRRAPVPVKLEARLTEIGTLEIWAESKISEHHWRLQFELRKPAIADTGQRTGPSTVIAATAVEEATRPCFARRLRTGAGTAARASRNCPRSSNRSLAWAETPGRSKSSANWPTSCSNAAEGRKKAPAWEARWLNLCGFCLRPGFGYPGDDFRMEQTRRIHSAGLAFANRDQNQIDWWIFWGRLAGGLKRNQQIDLYQRLSATLLPRERQAPADQRKPVARDVAHRREPGTAPRRDAHQPRRRARRQSPQRRVRRHRAVVPVATRRARAVLRSDQPGAPTRDSRQLGAGPAARRQSRRTAGVHGASDRRPDPRSPVHASRASCASGSKKTRTPTRLLAILDGEESRDAQSLSRIFGEELPAGLVAGA